MGPTSSASPSLCARGVRRASRAAVWGCRPSTVNALVSNAPRSGPPPAEHKGYVAQPSADRLICSKHASVLFTDKFLNHLDHGLYDSWAPMVHFTMLSKRTVCHRNGAIKILKARISSSRINTSGRKDRPAGAVPIISPPRTASVDGYARGVYGRFHTPHVDVTIVCFVNLHYIYADNEPTKIFGSWKASVIQQ